MRYEVFEVAPNLSASLSLDDARHWTRTILISFRPVGGPDGRNVPGCGEPMPILVTTLSSRRDGFLIILRTESIRRRRRSSSACTDADRDSRKSASSARLCQYWRRLPVRSRMRRPQSIDHRIRSFCLYLGRFGMSSRREKERRLESSTLFPVAAHNISRRERRQNYKPKVSAMFNS